MLDAAVNAGVAAFMAGESPPDDGEVYATLEAQGVEPWLAQRLVVFLPVAFGRVLLGDVALSDQLLDGQVARPLNSDPVFRAATARTAMAVRNEVERIGLRSPELNAVNNALNQGSELSDLQLGPVALPEPLPPAGTGDGGVPSPREVFAALLSGHGFPVEANGDVLRTGPFEIDARIFPRPAPSGVLAQVDFEVRHPALAAGSLLESFGAYGPTWKEAIGQAIRNFERSSLHPVIATLLDRSACQEQVEWERFPHPDGAFDLCFGPQLRLYSPGSPVPIGPIIDALLEALQDVPLRPSVHSLRLFTCHQNGAMTANEVLLDNEPWPAGEAITAAAGWVVEQEVVGTRVFALLSPAT